MALNAAPVTMLAQGGMATVYLGVIETSGNFSRLCAIKQIMPAYAHNRQFLEMFEREARICQALQHANVVQVLGFEPLDGVASLVMEYVHGVDFGQLARAFRKAGKPLPEPLVLTVISEVLKGLHYVHTRKNVETGLPLGVIHRDISFDNILISQEGEVKLSDFGIAKATTDTDLTQPGIIKGKLHYMSPEQASQAQLSSATDIYSVGIVLWEALTGKRLFVAGTDIEILELIKRGVTHENLQLAANGVHADLLTIMAGCLAANPAKRMNASELLRQLAEYMHQHWGAYNLQNVASTLQRIAYEELQRLDQMVRDALEVSRHKRTVRPANVAQAAGAASFAPQFSRAADTSPLQLSTTNQADVAQAVAASLVGRQGGESPIQVVVKMAEKVEETINSAHRGRDLDLGEASAELQRAVSSQRSGLNGNSQFAKAQRTGLNQSNQAAILTARLRASRMPVMVQRRPPTGIRVAWILWALIAAAVYFEVRRHLHLK